MSRIEIRSTPADVELFNGPERLGATPASLQFSPDTAPFEVTLKKKGFKEQKLRLQPDRNREYVIEMVKEHGTSSHASPASRPEPAAAKPAAPQPAPEPKVEAKPAGKLRDLKDPFAN
jgi:hypothetical protein